MGGIGSILLLILFGLIVGAIAKFIMPGRDPGGIIVTILIGIAGSLIGGFISAKLGLPWHPFISAVLGSILLLVILRIVRRAA